MSESEQEKADREAAERDQEQAQLEQDRADANDGHDLNTAGSASSTAGGEHPNQNATSYARTQETFAAEQMARSGVTPIPTYPQAVNREQREANHQEMALEHAKNVTGTADGVASVLPAIGGTTNMGLTTAEVLSQLDDGAVDGKGRLVGVYLDTLQEEQQQRHRERIEQAGTSPEAKAAAKRVRELASSPGLPAADIDKPADEQGLVDADKHTSADGIDPNDPQRRQRERVDTGAPGR